MESGDDKKIGDCWSGISRLQSIGGKGLGFGVHCLSSAYLSLGNTGATINRIRDVLANRNYERERRVATLFDM